MLKNIHKSQRPALHLKPGNLAPNFYTQS